MGHPLLTAIPIKEENGRCYGATIVIYIYIYILVFSVHSCSIVE